MTEELIGHVIVFAVRVVDGVVGFFGGLFALERKMKEGSLVGESPKEAESRRWWERLDHWWFWLGLLLLGMAAALGVSADWW